MNDRFFANIFVIFSFLLPGLAAAQPEIHLTSSHFIPESTDRFEFQLVDGQVNIGQSQAGHWGLSESARQWWFNPSQTLLSRVKVTNHTSDSNFVIYAPDNYTMESMTFRVSPAGGEPGKIQWSGSLMPFSDRTLQTRYLAAGFELTPGQSAVIEVAQWGTYKYKHNFHIMSAKSFAKLDTLNDQFFGFYFGILAISIAIFTAVYVGLRDRSFIMYVVFCSAFFLNAFSNIGFMGAWVGSLFGIPVASFARGLLSIPMFTAILFCQALLETKIHTPRWNHFLNLLVGLNVVYLILRMLPGHSLALSLGFTFLVLSSLIALTAIGFYRWAQGYRPAILYTVAWIFVFFGVVAWLLQSYNIIANTFATVHAAYIAQSLEVILLAATVVDRYSLVLRDAFKVKALAKERERLRDLLKMISHDLANPLTVITYGSARLLGGKISSGDDVKGLGAKFDRATKAMASILDGVRQMMALEDGKVDLVKAPVPVSEMVQELTEIFQDRLRDKDIILEIKDPDGLVLNVARTQFIYQVLCNILSNAVKFSPKGARIILEAKGAGGVKEISVRDFGMGMPEDLVSRIFSNEAKTTRLGTQGEKGTGFGMPLMKSYVEQMGGTVSVDSKVKTESSTDHGTKFTIRF